MTSALAMQNLCRSRECWQAVRYAGRSKVQRPRREPPGFLPQVQPLHLHGEDDPAGIRVPSRSFHDCPAFCTGMQRLPRTRQERMGREFPRGRLFEPGDRPRLQRWHEREQLRHPRFHVPQTVAPCAQCDNLQPQPRVTLLEFDVSLHRHKHPERLLRPRGGFGRLDSLPAVVPSASLPP